MNNIIIHGRLTRDPELRNTQTGKSVCNFAVAVDRDYKTADGDKQTDFFDCTAWGARGEAINKYFAKGKEIVVSGSMESRTYTDKNDNKRTAWEINVQGFDFCGSKSDGGSNSSYSAPAAKDEFAELSEPDEPLPF